MNDIYDIRTQETPAAKINALTSSCRVRQSFFVLMVEFDGELNGGKQSGLTFGVIARFDSHSEKYGQSLHPSC